MNIKQKLATGVVAFSYEKKDGTVKTTVGTTCAEILNPLFLGKKLIEHLEKPTGVLGNRQEMDKAFIEEMAIEYGSSQTRESKESGDNVTYYDFDAKGFRVFNINKIVEK